MRGQTNRLQRCLQTKTTCCNPPYLVLSHTPHTCTAFRWVCLVRYKEICNREKQIFCFKSTYIWHYGCPLFQSTVGTARLGPLALARACLCCSSPPAPSFSPARISSPYCIPTLLVSKHINYSHFFFYHKPIFHPLKEFCGCGVFSQTHHLVPSVILATVVILFILLYCF